SDRPAFGGTTARERLAQAEGGETFRDPGSRLPECAKSGLCDDLHPDISQIGYFRSMSAGSSVTQEEFRCLFAKKILPERQKLRGLTSHPRFQHRREKGGIPESE
ncbi:MAG: hypothetical protein D6743_14725, partial [Calditrichaeota bacterium]